METNPDNNNGKKPEPTEAGSLREAKLAKQLRDNLAKRKGQSRARNTKPRKFSTKTD